MRQTIELIGEFGILLRDSVAAIGPSLFRGRGSRLSWHNLWLQMNRIGIDSLPIVILVMASIGAILAMQMAPELAKFGMVPVTAEVVALATFREMGPLVSAVVLTGFGGSAIAAEIGTMVVGEEIEALEAHAIDPVRFLVVPRLLACIVMMVCLTVVGDLAAIAGGMLIGGMFLHLNPVQFYEHAVKLLTVGDFITGLIKAAVFGLEISIIACFLGLKVRGGAQGVGINTSRTVVMTIVALIITDLFFTTIFFYLGV
jgi:phospholipid/cholesterol/gamma-HCH transport system permease protein